MQVSRSFTYKVRCVNYTFFFRWSCHLVLDNWFRYLAYFPQCTIIFYKQYGVGSLGWLGVAWPICHGLDPEVSWVGKCALDPDCACGSLWMGASVEWLESHVNVEQLHCTLKFRSVEVCHIWSWIPVTTLAQKVQHRQFLSTTDHASCPRHNLLLQLQWFWGQFRH